MRSLEAEAATWLRGAVARVDQGGDVMQRPALFVYVLPDGRTAWVEPSYLDPYGAASPALHYAQQAVDVTPDGSPIAFFEAPSTGWAVTLYPADGEDPADVQAALAWALGELERRGTTWAAERVRVRESIAGELA